MFHKPALISLVAALFLTACESGGGRGGPDEFAVLPTRPLQQPANYVDLPQPTPGAVNRVDKVPDKDAIAALGGNPSSLDSRQIFASESALLARATRYGVEDGIRASLAQEDAVIRRTRGARLLERLSGQSNTIRAYEGFELDAEAEAERMRRLGIATPTPTDEPPEGARKYF